MDSSLKLTDAQLDAWCHAALILGKKIGVGSKKANEEFKELLNNFGSIRNVYQYFYSMLPLESTVIDKLDLAFSKVKVEYKVLSILDESYPEELRKIYGAPPVYYYRGDSNILQLKRSISFVGTRELDNPEFIRQGRNALERLISAGYQVIVSGLAKGSDTLGHKTAIELGARTIAVLGTPINIYYPAENRELQDKIATEHLLITEYPVGINSQGAYFANRNLTTVSLSYEGVVVARAGDKSGTQYAIKTCIEQKKELYILENNIHETDYQWVIKYKKHIKVVKDKR
ncbi:DNA processing protein DprA [Yersinia enterocolitica]|uniref:DNA processing protein DprA n=1 Tax=Yersinia TaxID=629 RepID=UPI0003D9149D|nr:MULTISPECIES: DNA processing protein DprA [Yersinia]EME3602464.1 DNA processing protein DprA [Yersinia enterocolitica]CCQ38884.1 putative DNA recombination-mediator SMF family protein [Yersinia enterocolitica (type O:5) str. YE53/03]HDL7379629.1 DNA processing protein DprA [Yersinia enterocolitica]